MSVTVKKGKEGPGRLLTLTNVMMMKTITSTNGLCVSTQSPLVDVIVVFTFVKVSNLPGPSFPLLTVTDTTL